MFSLIRTAPLDEVLQESEVLVSAGVLSPTHGQQYLVDYVSTFQKIYCGQIWAHQAFVVIR